MNNRTKLIAIYITVVLPLLIMIGAVLFYLDYRIACLCGGIMLIVSYMPMLKFGTIPYSQQSFIILPCSKPKMMIHRIMHALAQPYSIALIAIMLIGIIISPLGAASKILAMLLCAVQCISITAAGVFCENLYSDRLKAVRGAVQYLFCVGVIFPPLMSRELGVDEFLLFNLLWWLITIITTIIAAVAYPFAKRWVV